MASNQKKPKRLPTIAKMVNAALMSSDGRKAETTPLRKKLVSKYMTALMDCQAIHHIKGRGLVGRFKLADRREFERKIKTTNQTRTETRNTNEPLKSLRRPQENVPVDDPPPLSQVYELDQPGTSQELMARNRNILCINDDQFDTPMAPRHASTPMPAINFPLAPHRLQTEIKEQSVLNSIETTPRTSSAGKKIRRRKVY
ncbi:uncharacterized protein LOC131800374 isoform X2 [Musca domestica]|uniref:Uncharacterized protein LOC131800374 isoform X2 n=1 Tax=Musca domestica TaxID=7370 RepID=A0A9J7ICJ9_MUSDO|nr:uncharacterized protein LOC131800374 isoform X2 [Musca domestica]